MRIALDTNVLVYYEGVNDNVKQRSALDLLDHLDEQTLVLPTQVIGELFAVLSRRTALPSDEIRATVLEWFDGCEVISSTAAVMANAIDIASMHKLNIWDAVIVGAAAEAECQLLLSEDMQDGFVWRSLTVANPFAAIKHPLLAGILAR
jgi:predicted nucleic acid-binding protein